MKKGTVTRMAILRTALDLASREGLKHITIGSLAKARGMSKSGVYAHFKSKQKLQLEVVQYAQLMFSERVLRPTRGIDDTLARLTQIAHHWYHWSDRLSGGCFFIAAVVDFDDQDDPVAQELKMQQQSWYDHLTLCLRQGIKQGVFPADLNLTAFLNEFNGLYLSSQWNNWLYDKPQSEQQYQQAVASLLQRYQLSD